jgi:hypothetical protein
LNDEYNDEFDEKSEEEKEDISDEKVEIVESDSSDVPKGSKDLLGISESELEVYSLIITYGNATLGDLALLSRGRSIDQIQSQIDSLKVKKMIVELPGLIPRFQAVPPFDGLAEEVRQVSERIHTIRDELKEQVRKASTTVKDALIDITKQNLDSVYDLKNDSSSAKTSSLESVSSKTDILATLRDTTQQKYDTESSDLVSTWTGSTGNLLDSTKSQLQQISSESGDKLKHTFESAEVDIEELTGAFQNDLTSSLSSLESSTRAGINEQSNTVSSQLEHEKDSIKSKFNEVSTNIASSLSDINQLVMSSLGTTSEEVMSAITEGRNQITKTSTLAKSRIDNQYSTLEQEFDVALGEKAVEEEGYLQDHGTELDQAYSAMRTRQDSAIQSLETRLDDTQSKLLSSTDTILQSVSDKIDEIDSRSKMSVDTTMRSMKNNASTSIRKHHESLKQYTDEVTQETHSIMDLRKEKLKSNLQQMLADIQTTVSQEIESMSKALDELSVKIDTSYHGMITAMDYRAEQSNQELETKLSDLNEEATVTITQASSEAKNYLNELRTDIETAIQTSKAATSNTSSEFKQSATAASESFAETKTNLIESTTNKLQQTNESLLVKVSTLSEEGRTRMKEETVTLTNELHESLDGCSKMITSQIESSKSSVGDVFSTASQDAKSSLVTSSDSLTTKIDEINENTQNTLSSIAAKITDHKTESASKIQERVRSLTSGVAAITTKGSLEVDGSITDMTSKIEMTHEELRTSLSVAGDDIKSKSGNLLTKHLNLSSAELDEISSKLKHDISESYQKLDNQLDSLKGTLSGTMEKLEESPMVGFTEATLEETFASPSGDEVDTRDIAERLSKVWETVKAADFPGAKKTWNIVTRDAVNAHIKDMLTRAKSKVTLIVPEPSDIPISILTELKSSVGVELVVTESGALVQSVKSLIGRGNIRVRSRSEKDVFACVRDSEEVLMAPAASVDTDVIGVVSEDNGFVRFVMSIVGPIFQAKTKLLKPEDL